MRGPTLVVGRADLLLVAGLVLAGILTFPAPLARLLPFVRPEGTAPGLSLLAALVVLSSAFGIQQWRRRQAARREAVAAARTAQAATERAGEMARLVDFGQALGGALDVAAIAAVAATHLSRLSGCNTWVMTCARGQWEPLGAGPRDPIRERAASRAVDGDTRADGLECLPMRAGGQYLGVLGLACAAPLTGQQRRVLTAASSMLAASLMHAELFRQLKDSSVRDALTGCFNRQHGVDALDVELRRARRSHLPLSVVMFDLDAFKAINDRFGHLGGDAVLAMVGARMKETLRGSDLKCRYGGEEFLVLLPDTPLAGARRVAEALRQDLSEQRVACNGAEISVTASFGVTELEAGETDALAVIGRADAALYSAKQHGRNRVRAHEDLALMSPRQSLQPV
jgi:diguanylate cyclase (GGDEF)-like protein